MLSTIARILATFVPLLALAPPAAAIVVQVDWSAEIADPGVAGIPGPGSLSGTLGVFDVSAAGDTFLLPADGTLSVLVSGFTDGFPNGVHGFNRNFSSGPPELEFLTIGPTAADFSVNFVDDNTGILTAFPFACAVDAIAGNCFVGLYDEAGTGDDRASVSNNVLGSGIDRTTTAPVTFSFTVVPEPVTLALVAGGGLLLLGRSRRLPRLGL